MNFIKTIDDLNILINNDEPSKFIIDPDQLISENFFTCSRYERMASYHYKLENNDFMHIIVYNDFIIIEKSFYKGNYLDNVSLRGSELPTEVSYDIKGSIKNLSWKKGLELYRDGDFKPTNIRYSGDNVMFTYDNKNTRNNKICLSYITYNIKRNRIIDANMKFFKKVLDFRKIIDEFPEIINANELDCHDLSVNILTKNVITFKEMLNI